MAANYNGLLRHQRLMGGQCHSFSAHESAGGEAPADAGTHTEAAKINALFAIGTSKP